MTKREKLSQLSPCKIIECPLWNLVGCYGWVKIRTSQKNIYISNTLEEHQKLAVLAHELGHALCDKNNCKCSPAMKTLPYTSSLVEYHANKFAFKWLLDNKCKQALKYGIELIREQSLWSNHDPHGRAARCIMKLKLWQKCLDFVNTKSKGE